MHQQVDIIVIGAGIAGTSAAAALADDAKVIVLDKEAHPGYHSTGRSAATWAPFYGPDVIQQLTAISRSTLSTPPIELGGNSFTQPRGEMFLGRAGDEQEIEKNLAMGMEHLTMTDAVQLVPLLREDVLSTILYTQNMLTIDVDALHQAYIRKLKSHGSEIICNAAVDTLSYKDNLWLIKSDTSYYQAPVVVNAAGAWADHIASLAGVKTIGLQPKRRSAALVPYAQNADMPNWPMLFGAAECFYCTPFGNGMMISPADETNVDPHDAWPHDEDIAHGIDQFQQHIDYDVKSLTHQWAGLRTFAPDGEPVVGFDQSRSGFFWLAGQGGYGIQTSPAIAELCKALIQPQRFSGTNGGRLTDKNIHELAEKLAPSRYNN